MSFTVLEPSSVNSTANFTFANLTVTGAITLTGTGTTSNLGNVASANYFIGNGSLLTGITSGTTYANSNVADYLPTYTGNVSANYFIGNGSLLTGLPTSYSNTNVASYLPTYTGNVSANYFIGNGSTLTDITGANVTGYVPSASAANTASTVTTAAQPNITSTGTLLGLSVTGNLNITGNINATGNLNYSNVTDLVVGDPLIYLGANNTGNLYDLGFVASYNAGTYYHTGLARDASDGTYKLFDTVVAEPTTTIDFANGTYAPFQTGAFTSTGNITATNANLGNLVIANYFRGNGSLLTSTTGANVTGYVPLSSTANIAGTVTTNAQPNITSVGNLTTLTVTGNVSANYFIGNGALLTGISAGSTYSNSNVASYLPTYTGNVSANYFIGNGARLTNITGANVSGYVPLSTAANTTGTVTTNAQPNITSVGTLTSLTVTGNISGNYILGNGSQLTGIVAATATTAGTVTTNAQPNITSVGTLTTATITTATITTGNITTGNFANSVFTKFQEKVVSGGSVTGTITPDAGAGTIYTYTLTGSITLNSLTNAVAGTSMTLILTQGGTGSYGLTSTMKFAGGAKTLSSAVGSVDIISVFYDGTNYYAIISRSYA